jgi:hypothetical protein
MLSLCGKFFPFFEKGILYHKLLGYYNKKLVKFQDSKKIGTMCLQYGRMIKVFYFHVLNIEKFGYYFCGWLPLDQHTIFLIKTLDSYKVSLNIVKLPLSASLFIKGFPSLLRMKLSLPPKLVEKLVWVPVISFYNVSITSYGFDALLCRNWPFSPPNLLTLRITLVYNGNQCYHGIPP